MQLTRASPCSAAEYAMNTPLVSIITPTYNHAAVIGACIESVLAQTYQAWEMLIVDDGSTDDTWQIVQQFAARDARIRPVRQPNKGIWRLADTYNAALAQARGTLVAVLEGDDYWPKDKLQIQVAHHQRQPDLVLSHGRVTVARQGCTAGEYSHPAQTGLRSTTDYLRMLLVRQSSIMPVSVMLQHSALQAIGGFHQDPGFPAVDYATWIRLFQLPGRVLWIDACLGYWRQSAAQTTQQLGLALAEGCLQIALAQFDALPPPLVAAMQLNRRTIIRAHHAAVLMPVYFGCMRVALLAHDRRTALRYAGQLVRHGTAKRRLQGMYGAAMALTGGNVEPVLAIYERLVLQKSRASSLFIACSFSAGMMISLTHAIYGGAYARWISHIRT